MPKILGKLIGEGDKNVIIKLINVICGIWGLVILIKGISEVQDFSIKRAFFNVALPIFLIIGIIIGIVIPLMFG